MREEREIGPGEELPVRMSDGQGSRPRSESVVLLRCSLHPVFNKSSNADNGIAFREIYIYNIFGQVYFLQVLLNLLVSSTRFHISHKNSIS